MKIKLSRSQWEMIGSKAGWIKTSQSAFTGYEQKPSSPNPQKIYKGDKTILIAYKDDGSQGKHPRVLEYEVGSGTDTGPSPSEKDYHPLRGGVWSIGFSSEEAARDYIRRQLQNPKCKEVSVDVLYATLEHYNKINKVPSRL